MYEPIFAVAQGQFYRYKSQSPNRIIFNKSQKKQRILRLSSIALKIVIISIYFCLNFEYLIKDSFYTFPQIVVTRKKEQMDNYKVTVGDQVMDYNSEDVAALNSIPKKNQTFHVLREHESYEVEVIATDYLNKKFTIAVNGNSYEVGLEDAYDQMVQQMGLLANTAQKINEIHAPMPGLIIEIIAQEGQEIKEGDQLFILSAMKMENIILAPGDGTVKEIRVSTNDAVEKGQLIIEME